MKSTGTVRKIDELGRVVIPKGIRTDMDFKKKDSVEFLIDQDMIVLKKYYPACTFCGEKEKDEDNRYEFSDKTVCKSCAQWVSVMNN